MKNISFVCDLLTILRVTMEQNKNFFIQQSLILIIIGIVSLVLIAAELVPRRTTISFVAGYSYVLISTIIYGILLAAIYARLALAWILITTKILFFAITVYVLSFLSLSDLISFATAFVIFPLTCLIGRQAINAENGSVP